MPDGSSTQRSWRWLLNRPQFADSRDRIDESRKLDPPVLCLREPPGRSGSCI